jgi:hypothetical protein
MNAAALREILKRQPFTPFELVSSSGDRFPMRHPELVLLLKERVLMALDGDGMNDLPDRYTTISYLHIAAANPLETSGAGGKN